MKTDEKTHKALNKKIGRILSAEEYFGSRAALAAIVRGHVNPWLQMIPGMFIYEAYKRSRERRIYSRHYIFPRKIAMDAIRAIKSNAENDEALEEARLRIRNWLGSRKIFSDDIENAYMGMIGLIFNHYRRLLEAEGESHEEMLISAYQTQAGYEEYLNKLNGAERRIDRAIVEKYNDDALRNELLSRQSAKEELREKDAKAIF